MKAETTIALLVVLMGLAGALALAASPSTVEHLVITDLPPEAGDYYLLVRRGVDGSLSASRIPAGQVITLGDPGDPPEQPDNPPVDEHAALRKTLREATAAVVDANKAASKRSVARLYGVMRTLPFKSRAALSDSTDNMFAALGLGQSWAAWKVATDAALADYNQLDEALAAWAVVSEVLSQ